MRKTASILILAVLAGLLLTGCQGLPNSLEDLIDWRGKFLLPMTVETVQYFVGDILLIVVVIATARGLFGHIEDLQNEVPILQGRLASTLLLITSAALVYQLIPTANTLTQNLMPPELTIDKLLTDLHLNLLTIDPVKMITQVWAVSFSITLPLLVAYALLSSLIFAVMTLVISAIWQLSKALWVIVSVWIGHIMFIKVFVMIEQTMGKAYPAWKLADVGNASAGYYIGLTLVALAFCYYVVPLIGLFFGPNIVGPKSAHAKEAREERQRAKVDLDEIIPILIPTGSPPPPQSSPAPTTMPSSGIPDDNVVDIVDGEYRFESAGELGTGQKMLDSGSDSPPENPQDPGGSPSSPNSPPPTSGSGSPNPDWAPPITPSQNKDVDDKSDPSAPPLQPNSESEDDIVEGEYHEITPKSRKIRKARGKTNDILNIAKVGATIIGAPEVGTAIQGVQTVANPVLGAMEARAKSKEPAPDPDWAPPITKKGT